MTVDFAAVSQPPKGSHLHPHSLAPPGYHPLASQLGLHLLVVGWLLPDRALFVEIKLFY